MNCPYLGDGWGEGKSRSYLILIPNDLLEPISANFLPPDLCHLLGNLIETLTLDRVIKLGTLEIDR